MHKRIAMDALGRYSGVYRLRRRDAEQDRAFEHQEWPERLLRVNSACRIGSAEPRPVTRSALGKQRVKPLLGEARRVSKPLHNPH
jgi:hypothetical protein